MNFDDRRFQKQISALSQAFQAEYDGSIPFTRSSIFKHLLDRVTTPRFSQASQKGYSRGVVSGSSVNVMANPVRVAPMPKVIAHVPTNMIITTCGVGL
jgi:hypothetical protein